MAQAERYRALSVQLRGKVIQLPPDVPRGDIAYLMGKTHIGTDDRLIVRDIWRRTAHWPEVSKRKAAVRCALQIMDDNRRIVIDYRL
jgi:hypothetical protein